LDTRTRPKYLSVKIRGYFFSSYLYEAEIPPTQTCYPISFYRYRPEIFKGRFRVGADGVIKKAEPNIQDQTEFNIKNSELLHIKDSLMEINILRGS
jgi:hypothetical protein